LVDRISKNPPNPLWLLGFWKCGLAAKRQGRCCEIGLSRYPYVKECLAPVMKKSDTLMLDNLSSHKVKDALKPLYDKDIKLVFLPPYSHDFNPIELAWSKIKAYLRKVKARAFDKLFSALGLAFDTISHDDFSAWMKHCGYRLALVKLL